MYSQIMKIVRHPKEYIDGENNAPSQGVLGSRWPPDKILAVEYSKNGTITRLITTIMDSRVNVKNHINRGTDINSQEAAKPLLAPNRSSSYIDNCMTGTTGA